MNTNTKTPMIKGRAYNQIARFFHPKDEMSKKTDAEKLEAIETLITQARTELYWYKVTRRHRRELAAERAIRTAEKVKTNPNFKPKGKRKTSKEQYEKMLAAKSVAA